MRILLDENLLEGLIEPLRFLGHAVDSVGSLRLKGLDNGRLYREVAEARSGQRDLHGHTPTAGGSVRDGVHGEFCLNRLDFSRVRA